MKLCILFVVRLLAVGETVLRQEDRVPVTIVKKGKDDDTFEVDAHLEGETRAATITRDQVTTLTTKLMEQHGTNCIIISLSGTYRDF